MIFTITAQKIETHTLTVDVNVEELARFLDDPCNDWLRTQSMIDKDCQPENKELFDRIFANGVRWQDAGESRTIKLFDKDGVEQTLIRASAYYE